MKKIIKQLCVFVVVMLALSLTSGCVSPADNDAVKNTTGQAEETQKPVTLSVWGGTKLEGGTQKLHDNFTAKFPHITVEYTFFVNDDNGNVKLDTALMAGQQIDAYYTYKIPAYEQRAKSGVAEDLGPYIQRDNFNLTDIGEGIMQIDGKYYMIPAASSVHFIMANKDMFDEANIPLPTEWDAEQFREIAKKLTKGEGNDKIYGMMWRYSFNHSPFQLAFAALGVDSYLNEDKTASNFHRPEFRQNLQLRYDMQYVDKSEFPYVNAVSQKADHRSLFYQGRLAMYWSGLWDVPSALDNEKYPRDFTVAFLPVVKLSKDQDFLGNEGTVNANMMMINSKSANKDAAWEYIKYTATEGAYDIAETGRLPLWRKADKNKVASRLLGDNPEKYLDMESFNRVVLGWDGKSCAVETPIAQTQVWKIIKEECEKYFTDAQSLDATIEAIKTKSDQFIKEAQ